MSQGRSSLLSEGGFDNIGAKDAGSKGKGKMDTVTLAKLCGGAVALVLGVFLILRSMGVFGGGPTPPVIPEAKAQEIEAERAAERKKIEIETNSTVAGS
jgi:hypothetical protein